MRIGIVGSGDVGRALADAFIATGNEVIVGTRTPAKLEQWISKHESGRAAVGNFSDAASRGEVVVIATLWAGTKDAIRSAGPENMAGKFVIDVTNPLEFTEKGPKLALGFSDSAGETVQRLLPSAKVVKAFNTVGSPHMYKPDFPGGPPAMFICGNDEEAKAKVTRILDSFGWETVDIGGIEGSRLLESLAMLWIVHYLRKGSGNHAFKLLQK